MDPLPPIPTPLGQRWREFRIQILPLLVFVAILVAVVILWKNYVAPASIVGQVETNTVTVTTTVAGLLTGISVEPFQEVKEGELLASVAPFDPEMTAAALNAIEAGVRLTEARMWANEVQSLDAGARLRLDLLLQETTLAIAKVKLAEAETNLIRITSLVGVDVFAQAQLDVAKATRDAYRTEVEQRTHLVSEWRRESRDIFPFGGGGITNIASLIEQEIHGQQEQIRQLQKPIVLKAPINGRISAVHHRSGERITTGTPILSIVPTEPKRIVAYVRQPLNYHPKAGDMVTVSTRATQRKTSPAQVLQVGAQLEMISLYLLPADRPRPEQGLPIAISLPPSLNLLPGELVDIYVTSVKN